MSVFPIYPLSLSPFLSDTHTHTYHLAHTHTHTHIPPCTRTHIPAQYSSSIWTPVSFISTGTAGATAHITPNPPTLTHTHYTHPTNAQTPHAHTRTFIHSAHYILMRLRDHRRTVLIFIPHSSDVKHLHVAHTMTHECLRAILDKT